MEFMSRFRPEYESIFIDDLYGFPVPVMLNPLFLVKC